MDKEEISGTSKGLTSRIEELQKQNEELISEVEFGAEFERDYLLNEMNRLKRELREVKKELARLKKPPLIVGLIKENLPNGKAIIESSTGPNFIVSVADYIPDVDLKPGTRVAMNKQTLSIVRLLPPSVDPHVMGAEIIDKPLVTYQDIGGLEDQIVEVRETVEDPLLHPYKYKRMGIEPPKGVLLVGQPGTGKTLIAKAAANRTQATFIKFVGSELVQKYIGEGARLVRELFSMAKEKSPSIIFIDELDSVAAKRLDQSTSGDREVQRTMMQLLSELDGFEPVGDVKVMAATNRPELLDKALLRPGRFDRIIDVPMPDKEARKKIFEIHSRNMPMAEDIDLETLARRSEEASGADIKAICTEAGMLSLRKEKEIIDSRDFFEAIEKVLDDSTNQNIEGQVMFA